MIEQDDLQISTVALRPTTFLQSTFVDQFSTFFLESQILKRYSLNHNICSMTDKQCLQRPRRDGIRVVDPTAAD